MTGGASTEGTEKVIGFCGLTFYERQKNAFSLTLKQ